MTAKVYDHLPSILLNIKHDKFVNNLLKKLLIFKEYYTVQEYFDTTITEKEVLKFTTIKNVLKFS
jgi:hypothetical protein